MSTIHNSNNRIRNSRLWFAFAAVAITGLCATAVASGGAQPAGSAGTISSSAAGARQASPSNLDARRAGPAGRPPAGVVAARARLGGSLGNQGVLETDRATGAVRSLGRLNGFLTDPSTRAASRIALDYVRAHHAAFGISASDVDSLRLRAEFANPDGIRHLSFRQEVGGVPVFGAGLKASVTGDGRLINVVDGPVPALGVRTTTPHISAADAVRVALRDGGATKVAPGPVKWRSGGVTRTTGFGRGNRAGLVIFPTASGGRLGWLVNANATSTRSYIDVVDASTGDVLFRQNTVSFDSDATGKAWQYYPSDLLPAGTGSQATVHFPVDNTGSKLSGNNSHTYADIHDDIVVPGGAVPAGAEIPATTTGTNPIWSYTASLDTSRFFGNCDPHWACTWDSSIANNWQPNRNQNGTQVFYYVNQFHDFLLNDLDIAFTPAAGNFQVSNNGQGGVEGDAVQAQVDDGADTAFSAGGSNCGTTSCGFPDNKHIVNANMSTQQDGIPPRMQMYLFPAFDLNSTAPDANGGDDASVIYHEYVHGLSNRLVTDPNGIPALAGFQARSMGEAWSDWYAMDYLIVQSFDADTGAIGDVQVGFFVGGGTTIPLRSEPMDCPNDGSSHSGVCPGGSTTGPGGYSYGDMGKIIASGPEVHADGEIWGQTLWQIRQTLGVNITEKLVTEGMELSPVGPTFLDMRNAILQADQAAFGGSHLSALWTAFVNRGMGFFATTTGGSDSTPVEDFSTPPTCPTQCTTISGTITDTDTTLPVSGVTVGIRGHNSGLANDLAGVSNASGQYTISNVPQSHNYVLEISKVSYLPVTANVSVGTGSATANATIARDWAAISGGASVTSFTPPDYSSSGCGPAKAFDLSQASGWGSDSPSNSSSGVSGPRSVILHLPAAVDIRQLQIDPGATCGDTENAGVQAFTVETRTSAVANWATAWSNSSALPAHAYTPYNPSSGTAGVVDIRMTMQSNRGNADFMDMSELLILGKPQQTHTLTVSKAGAGSGTVTSSPPGIDCGSTCSHDFADGTPVTLTATVASGSSFAGWSGDCSGTGTCTLTMSANHAATATFTLVPKTLTVSKAGSGAGTVTSSPAGIDCGSTCSHAFADGTSVILTATAASGSSFAGWSGDCSGTGTCTLTMSANHAATATFQANSSPPPPPPPSQKKCVVPKVKGKKLAAAKTAIKRAHCSVGKVRKAFSARVKKGRVISQKPAPGKRLRAGSKVNLKVSKGKP